MNCPFYGKHPLATGLIDSLGNQCALIVDAFSPCVMEVWQEQEPDLTKCDLLHSASLARDLIQAGFIGPPGVHES